MRQRPVPFLLHAQDVPRPAGAATPWTKSAWTGGLVVLDQLGRRVPSTRRCHRHIALLSAMRVTCVKSKSGPPAQKVLAVAAHVLAAGTALFESNQPGGYPVVGERDVGVGELAADETKLIHDVVADREHAVAMPRGPRRRRTCGNRSAGQRPARCTGRRNSAACRAL